MECEAGGLHLVSIIFGASNHCVHAPFAQGHARILPAVLECSDVGCARRWTDMADAQTATRPTKTLEEFAAILHARDIRALFQPVVNIGDGQVVGYEALARGPASSAFESPE